MEKFITRVGISSAVAALKPSSCSSSSCSSCSSSFVFFWKPNEENGLFSNWSHHSVIDEDIKFKTTEHFLMYHKALLMHDLDSAAQIIQARNPQVAKNLGKSVRNWDENKWEKQREDIMFKGLWLKATQHQDVKKCLMETYVKIIAEASPFDTIWGIGLLKSDKRALNQNEWLGKNLLGKTWMKVRESLL